MSIIRSTSNVLRITRSRCSRQLRYYSDDVVQEGDIVLLKNVKSKVSQPVLTPALAPGKKLKLQFDSITHDDILGKSLARSVVVSKMKKAQYRIHRPTLGEYTDNSPRIVTPIYSQDASLIVSLLDLNPSVPSTSDEKLEIFEAGTGHGALTLFLSRAIHGANTAPPMIPGSQEAEENVEYNAWLSKRRAVIHTLDISEKHSRHARSTVKGFRRGIYFSNIDFHVGTIEDYLKPRLDSEDPFLDHAILDLPNVHLNMDIVSQALKGHGSLVTFCPSITQITACLEEAKEQRLPLFLESVIEIGGSVGVGGRDWDVRRVQVRSPESKEPAVKAGESRVGENEDLAVPSEDKEPRPSSSPLAEEQKWEMVCRPRVGTRVVGGGFVGLWRKKA